MEQKLALSRMPRPKASQDLLAMLEELREHALAGKVTSFVYVSADVQRCVSSGFWFDEKRNGLMAMIGEAECLKERIKDEVRRRNEGEI